MDIYSLRRYWLQGVRDNIGVIEGMELSALGFGIWLLFLLLSIGDPEMDLPVQIFGLGIIQGALLGTWLLYNLYIRLARAGGQLIDIALWVLAATFTSSYTFWAWTILDVNRLIMSKLFYRGEAPLEYAWSLRSKQVRKLWERGIQHDL